LIGKRTGWVGFQKLLITPDKSLTNAKRKAFRWGKKKRNPYSEHHKEKVKLKELYYGLILLFAKTLGMRLVPF
jgi:hypothetical protein